MFDSERALNLLMLLQVSLNNFMEAIDIRKALHIVYFVYTEIYIPPREYRYYTGSAC